jgi:transketolase
MDIFGASGKGSEVYKYFGFDADKIVEKLKDIK